MLPILLHIPHASLIIPDDLRGSFLLDASELEDELLAMTDRYTDELFQLEGAERLVFPVSRLVVDPERFRDDTDEPMAATGMGAVYTLAHDGRRLKTAANREDLMRRFYDPHHARLDAWAERALAEHGTALLIDCHSYPRRPIPCDRDQVIDRPDACVGTDEFHTPDWLREATVSALKAEGWSVFVDKPYAGTMTPNAVYGMDPRCMSVMIELNRGLYMDNLTGQRLEGFGAVKEAVGRVLGAVAAECVRRYPRNQP